jgi:hypothetical protein
MYKVVKDRGGYATVTLEDTDTSSTMMIGKLSRTIIDTLTKCGIKFDTREADAVDTFEAWNFEVTRDTAHELAKLTMAMNKPIRTQKIKTEQKADKSEMTALDIIFGN